MVRPPAKCGTVSGYKRPPAPRPGGIRNGAGPPRGRLPALVVDDHFLAAVGPGGSGRVGFLFHNDLSWELTVHTAHTNAAK